MKKLLQPLLVCGLLAMTFSPKTQLLASTPNEGSSGNRDSSELMNDALRLFDQRWKALPVYQNHKAWMDTFNALLTTKENYAKAAKVKQKSDLQNTMFETTMPSDPIFMQTVKTPSGNAYILVITVNPILMYPGHGSISYYWFTEHGLLMGADLMNTGHRCNLVDVSTANLLNDKAMTSSELNFSLKFNDRDPFVACFTFQEDGLKLVGYADANGHMFSNGDRANSFPNGLHVGETLMAP